MMKLICVVLTLIVLEVSSHGMMLDPPNRSSLWRFPEFGDSPVNYDDNQNFCGGFHALWELNNGKCGVCGDPYTSPHPQDNENTGLYGEGKVVRKYSAGETITTKVHITANHLGHIEFHLCVLSHPDAIEHGEECFGRLEIEGGTTQYEYPIVGTDAHVVNRIKLPAGVTCDRCVLRWHYRAGNNWGTCANGEIKPGCGQQEVFRSCADISIV